LQKQGFAVEDTICFREWLNDLEMLTEVAIGVSNGNALGNG